MGISLFQKELIDCAKKRKKVFILGRGYSTSLFLKNINKYKNKNLIIGFNSSEIIDEINFYFTNKKIIPKSIPPQKLLRLNKIINLYKREIEVYKLGSIKFSIDPLLFLINQSIGMIKTPLKIVFVGFDFRTSMQEGDYKLKKRKNIIQSHIDISSQRDLFFKRKNAYKNIKIFHAGFDLHSDFDPRENFFTKKTKHHHFKVKVVAEITTNHHGETKNIIDLIYGAKKAGADYVKFQMRDVESFYPKKILEKEYKSPFGRTFKDYRNQLELTDEQVKLIFNYSKKIGIKPFFSILDIKSFQRLKKYNFDLIKIPSTISEDTYFLKYIQKNYKGEIVVSTGMTNHDYFLKCAKLFKNNKTLYLMHCISSYPTVSSDVHLGVISSIKNLSLKFKNIVPGYSSHDLTTTASAMAIACGARLVEKHIKINAKNWSHFDSTALDVNYEFPSWVQHVRSSEKMLGDEIKKIYKSEHHKYFFRKS